MFKKLTLLIIAIDLYLCPELILSILGVGLATNYAVHRYERRKVRASIKAYYTGKGVIS
jgi:hypothetical protein